VGRRGGEFGGWAYEDWAREERGEEEGGGTEWVLGYFYDLLALSEEDDDVVGMDVLEGTVVF
jgi:hypothetical protein